MYISACTKKRRRNDITVTYTLFYFTFNSLYKHYVINGKKNYKNKLIVFVYTGLDNNKCQFVLSDTTKILFVISVPNNNKMQVLSSPYVKKKFQLSI